MNQSKQLQDTKQKLYDAKVELDKMEKKHEDLYKKFVVSNQESLNRWEELQGNYEKLQE